MRSAIFRIVHRLFALSRIPGSVDFTRIKQKNAAMIAVGTVAFLILHAAVPPSAAAQGGVDLPPTLPDGAQRAFPTAEGHGAAAKGGRGGVVIFVTNLSEQGRGSLRACIEAQGPRTCVFRVSGTIVLENTSIVATSPFLTIAGETAPGDGIAIRNGPVQLRPSLEIKTHDVIVRHIRFRPGPHREESCCSGAIGVYTKNAKDVIFDHISASWGSDETMDSEHAERLTVQWSIFSEPLLNGGPGKRNRARNMLLSQGGDFSIHHNLFAYSVFRNPQVGPETPGTTLEVVNNVLYSPYWEYIIALANKWIPVEGNVIGNVKFSGENFATDRLIHFFDYDDKGFKIYLKDNWDEDYRSSNDVPEDSVVAPQHRRYISPDPVLEPLVQAQPAMEALENVLQTAGATRPRRDAVDERIVLQVRQRRGGLVQTNPEDVGGWPELRTETPPEDADQDGMADEWERRWGLNPDNPIDSLADADGDGWTNLEEYLHELAGDGVGMQDAPVFGGSQSGTTND